MESEPKLEIEDSSDEGSPKSWMDSAKKWIGLGAAVFSALSAVYGGLEYQAEKKARSRESAELLATSQTQLKGGDYAGAWASLKGAQDEIDKEGVIVRALGGLTREQAAVHRAQEQLAMNWLRHTEPSGQTHIGTQVADTVLPVLSSGADQAPGPAKADLLAHIGWANWLKTKEGAKGLHELQFYKDAIALDPHNPYANTFWAIPVMEETSASEAGVKQAKQLYDAALSSDRAQGEVRQWVRRAELNTVRRYVEGGYQYATSFYWQVIGEMQKTGEPIDERQADLYDLYKADTISVAAFSQKLDQDITYLPVAVHVQLLQGMIKTEEDKDRLAYLQFALAVALEKAGKPQEAVAMWRTVRSGPAVQGLGGDVVAKDIDATIQRLSGGSAPAAAPANTQKPATVTSPRRR